MRGVETRIQEIRRMIFREVARMAYDTENSVAAKIEELPYEIIPGEVGNFRNDVFLERAIVGERLRLAMGLPCRSAAEHAPLSDNIALADQAETYYTPPLINIIKFACNACAEKRVYVTEGCQGCLAHPCVEVCPKKAVTLDRTNGRSVIDTEKCIKCGKCAEVCSYNAIIVQERPCAKACGMDAIGSDENGKAVFKDPQKAFEALVRDYSDGINLIRDEYKLGPITPRNFYDYMTYGYQVNTGTEESKNQAVFISKVLDIYENSYDFDK